MWTGESEFEPGTLEFYEEHRKVYFDDYFAGSFDPHFLPTGGENTDNLKIVDLGCGIGFWTTEFGLRGFFTGMRQTCTFSLPVPSRLSCLGFCIGFLSKDLAL